MKKKSKRPRRRESLLPHYLRMYCLFSVVISTSFVLSQFPELIVDAWLGSVLMIVTLLWIPVSAAFLVAIVSQKLDKGLLKAPSSYLGFWGIPLLFFSVTGFHSVIDKWIFLALALFVVTANFRQFLYMLNTNKFDKIATVDQLFNVGDHVRVLSDKTKLVGTISKVKLLERDGHSGKHLYFVAKFGDSKYLQVSSPYYADQLERA